MSDSLRQNERTVEQACKSAGITHRLAPNGKSHIISTDGVSSYVEHDDASAFDRIVKLTQS